MYTGKVLAKFIENMRKVGKAKTCVKIGYPKTRVAADDLEKAIQNNYGTRRIPRRPFFDNASEKTKKQWADLMEQHKRDFRDGRVDLKKLYNAIGVVGVANIQSEIIDGNFVPNSPKTIKRKRSSRPLVDTGDMRLAVTYVTEGV